MTHHHCCQSSHVPLYFYSSVTDLIVFVVCLLQLVDEEFDALEGFFYVLENGILELLENVETYLLHLQVYLFIYLKPLESLSGCFLCLIILVRNS